MSEQSDEKDALSRVMAAMGCKVTEDVGECPSCGSAPCGPHGSFWYCDAHDWHEDDTAEDVCGYALLVTRAALDTRPIPPEVTS